MISKEQFLKFKMQHPLESVKANQLRDESFDRFLIEGLPSKKEEYWRYADLKPLQSENWTFVSNESFLSHEQMRFVADNLLKDATPLVFVNGYLNATLSDSEFSPYQAKDITDQDFITESNVIDEKINTLTNALLYQKHQLVLKNLTKPIHIFHFITEENQQRFFYQPFFEIIVESHEKAEILQSYYSEKDKTPALHAEVKVILKNGSQLTYVQNQNLDSNALDLSRTDVLLASDATLNFLDLTLGAKNSRHNLNILFKGAGSAAYVNSLSMVSHQQKSDYLTLIHHQTGLNQSVQNHRTIAAHESESIFRGRVRIEQDAQKANSEQLCKNLLLTSKAHAVSIPQLEIYADDVKATHGATMGELNQEEIFYFLSRGINALEASHMMATGFAVEQVGILENLELRQHVIDQIQNKLKVMIKND